MRKVLGALALSGGALLAYRYREKLSAELGHLRAIAGIHFLARTDGEVSAALTTSAQRRFIKQGQFAAQLLSRACEAYKERTFLVRKDPSGAVSRTTYGQLWSRVEALAGALHHEFGIQPGENVGIRGFSGLDWLAADMACLYLGAVSVPLEHQLDRERLAEVTEETSMRLLFFAEQLQDLPTTVETVSMERPESELERLVSLGKRCKVHRPEKGALHSIVYTSGSTGRPKGVMLPYHRWTATLRDGVESRSSRIDYGYLPLAHMAGRITAYKALMSGGVLYLAGGTGMADFLQGLTWARPTHLLAVPRISQFLHQQFQSSHMTGREFHRRVLGGRLRFVHTGAAPTASETFDFLRKTLRLQVTDVYGSTEMGPVAVNGRVCSGVSYKLVSRPELGFTTDDRPYPRGELAIKSARATTGYFNDPEATRKLRDREGYVLSGDIVEERAPGKIAWLGRSKGVLRLGHGKFVPVTNLEGLFCSHSSLIHQIYLHGETGRDYLLAVVVPAPTFRGGPAEMLSELRRVAAEQRLPSHEVPRGVLLERTPFSSENGLLSAAQKPLRPQLARAYENGLKELYSEIEVRRGANSSATLEEVAAQVLGLSEVSSEHTFQQLGGDSLAASEMSMKLKEKGLGDFPASLFLDPSLSLGQVAERQRRQGLSFQQVHGTADRVTVQDLCPLRVSGNPGGSVGKPSRVLLTGASGFLGRHLGLELLRLLPPQTRLLCLVRGGEARLFNSFHSADMAREFRRLSEGRLIVLEGDLGCRRFGVSAEEYERLSQVDTIVHAGALVNHSLPYRDLFATNVQGTAEIARLAVTGQPKAVHLISSAGLFAGLQGHISESDDAATLWPDRRLDDDGYAAGYVTSKWASEVLVDWLYQDTELPVTISRCGMLVPGREYPSEINKGDTFTRLFLGIAKTGLAPLSFYQEPRAYNAVRVDVAARFLAHLVRQTTDGRRVYHLTTSFGPTLDDMVGWIEESRSIERLPYTEFFQQFRTALKELGPNERERSLWPILDRWRKPIARKDHKADNKEFRQACHEFELSEQPELTRKHFLRVIEEFLFSSVSGDVANE